MASPSSVEPVIPRIGTWPIVAIAALTASWLLFYGSLIYGFHLRKEYGPIPDVWDALMCGAYVGERTWPWRMVVFGLDFLAIVFAAAPPRHGRARFASVAVIALAVPSLCLHGLALVLTGLLTV